MESEHKHLNGTQELSNSRGTELCRTWAPLVTKITVSSPEEVDVLEMVYKKPEKAATTLASAANTQGPSENRQQVDEKQPSQLKAQERENKKWSTAVPWRRGSLEGLQLVRYNANTFADKSIQESILTNRLKAVINKGFNLLVVLSRGFKVRLVLAHPRST